MTPEFKLTKARAALIQSARFYGSLALGLKVQEGKVATLAVDGRTLFFNPTWVESQSMPEIIGTIAQGVTKIANLHHTRRKGRDQKKWNKASEYTVNPILLKAGFTLPEGALVNPAWEGKSAEDIYRLLPDENESNSTGGNEAGGDGEGQGEGDSEGQANGTPGVSCEVLDAVGEDGAAPSQAELADMEAETQVKVVQAANLAKQAGQGTLDIDRLVDRIKEAQQDWKEELRRFIMQRSRDDYSWTRPDKRFVGRGIYLPSLRSERMGTLVVGVDMSGSCSDWFDDFYVQLKAIHEDLRPEKLVVIYCADRVARVEEFAGDDELDLHPYGAGGTDLRAIFRHVEEMDIEPACLVMLSDLYTPFDDNAPEYPVLWAATTEVVPPWGEYIRLRR